MRMKGFYIYNQELKKKVTLPNDILYCLGGEELVLFLNKFQQFQEVFKGAVDLIRKAMSDPFAFSNT